MKLLLTLVLLFASTSALVAQPVDNRGPSPAQRIRTLQATAQNGRIADLEQILAVVRDSLALDRRCDQPGRLCSAKEAAIDVLATWVENWADDCPAEQRPISDLRAALEALSAALTITATSTREDRERARRLQDALAKLQRCPGLHQPQSRVWFASVAPGDPAYEKEQWIVNCGPTPYGRWTIMRTEGPAAGVHEILGGVLDLKEGGTGEYSLDGIGKSNGRGRYKETGVVEFSPLPGAPGQYMLVLRGTWSDRVADGRGGWVAKRFKFGDISFQVEQRSMPCPSPQTR